MDAFLAIGLVGIVCAIVGYAVASMKAGGEITALRAKVIALGGTL